MRLAGADPLMAVDLMMDWERLRSSPRLHALTLTFRENRTKILCHLLLRIFRARPDLTRAKVAPRASRCNVT
jgi:hypothetical protein